METIRCLLNLLTEAIKVFVVWAFTIAMFWLALGHLAGCSTCDAEAQRKWRHDNSVYGVETRPEKQ